MRCYSFSGKEIRKDLLDITQEEQILNKPYSPKPSLHSFFFLSFLLVLLLFVVVDVTVIVLICCHDKNESVPFIAALNLILISSKHFFWASAGIVYSGRFSSYLSKKSFRPDTIFQLFLHFLPKSTYLSLNYHYYH